MDLSTTPLSEGLIMSDLAILGKVLRTVTNTVGPHLTFQQVLRLSVTCNETSSTLGELIEMRLKFLWHLLDVITK